MTLKSYLTQSGLSVAAFARRVGLPIMTVHRHAAGTHIPRRRAMALYEKHTDGAVTAADFYAAAGAQQ